MRVLIAEDETRLADAIARGLRREGMAVDLAGDGGDALLKARVIRYDVVVLDRDLPTVHGDEICQTLRGERPETLRGHGPGVPVEHPHEPEIRHRQQGVREPAHGSARKRGSSGRAATVVSLS